MRFITLITMLLCNMLGGGLWAHAATPAEAPALGYSIDMLRKLNDLVTRTGTGQDTIAALYRPKFVNVSDASLSMDDDEVVFVVYYPNENITRIYPQRILVWHEVVNDVLPDKYGNTAPVPGLAETAGHSYTISYSPISGTVVGFRSMAGKYPSTFGVSGDLLNANSVLYDRISNSYWSQLLGLCIEGPLRGKRLERIPVLWAKWGGVKELYNGKAEVLSRSTGHKRSYGKDPYGSYQIKGTYYDNVQLIYPITRLDPRLPPKKRILGIEIDSLLGAVQVDAVKEARVLNFSLGVNPMVAIYDAQLDAVRIFDRRIKQQNNQVLTFTIFEDKLVDELTKSQWEVTGNCSYGSFLETQLTPVYAIDSMWFSWAAFHKATQVFPPPAQ